MALDARSYDLDRLAAGWITKTAILANSAYLFSNFSVGSDQKSDNQTIIPWLAPTNKSQIARRSVYDQMVSGKRQGQGFTNFNLVFGLLTFSMMTVFYGYYTDPDQAQAMTALVYDQRNVVRVWQGYMAPFNEWGTALEPIQGGWINVTIPFSGCTENTA